MNAKWAENNLKTIRCLMEQASVYRRAMAPLAIIIGIFGITAAGLAEAVDWVGPDYFALYWIGVAIFSVLVALFLIRIQALKSNEPFWSPPTRRVANAMIPLLLAGLGLGVLEFMDKPDVRTSVILAAHWMILYGGALHAAGFFMQRGIKLLGWIYIILGFLLLIFNKLNVMPYLKEGNAHWLMAFAFGIINLAYGFYLKLTEESLEAK
ncbi:MAG: hypothetical protein CMO44_15795 [Verrucomicrobiales bacterium]|nr:hypothetical protein [Verrucomicrobiales bacterium]